MLSWPYLDNYCMPLDNSGWQWGAEELLGNDCGLCHERSSFGGASRPPQEQCSLEVNFIALFKATFETCSRRHQVGFFGKPVV